MTEWNLISSYGNGEVLEVVEGSFSKAAKRKRELKKEHGSGIVISQAIC